MMVLENLHSTKYQPKPLWPTCASTPIKPGRRVPTTVGARRGGFHMGRGWNPENSLLGAGEGAALSRCERAVEEAI